MVSAADSLDALLTASPSALVAAVGPDGRTVPVPRSVVLYGQRAFDGPSGIDLVVGDDQRLILDGWMRAREEPAVRIEVHTLCDPDRVSVVSFFDVRDEHGVHVVVIEAPDPDLVLRFVAERSTRHVGVGQIKRDAIATILDVG